MPEGYFKYKLATYKKDSHSNFQITNYFKNGLPSLSISLVFKQQCKYGDDPINVDINYQHKEPQNRSRGQF